MDSGDASQLRSGGDAKGRDALAQRRAIATKLRAVRKREFAILRDRMRAAEDQPNTVAGIRGRAVSDRPANNQTIEKIERIGAHLEALWNPGAVSAMTPNQATEVTPETPPARSEFSNNSAPHLWPADSLWSQPTSPAALTSSLALSLDFTSNLNTPSAVKQVDNVTAQADLIKDPLMQEIAGLFALRKYLAIQTLLLSRLGADHEHTRMNHLQVLALLESYRLMDNMDAFDDTVLAYVHWWNGITPSWQTAIATKAQAPWILQGALQGANSLQLPELDLIENREEIAIDCTALRHMDTSAAKALSQWLVRAKSRNYAVTLNGGSVLVYLLWCSMDIAKHATVQAPS